MSCCVGTIATAGVLVAGLIAFRKVRTDLILSRLQTFCTGF